MKGHKKLFLVKSERMGKGIIASLMIQGSKGVCFVGRVDKTEATHPT